MDTILSLDTANSDKNYKDFRISEESRIKLETFYSKFNTDLAEVLQDKRFF